MKKNNIHPKTFIAKIFCENALILQTLSTRPEIRTEIWSGNHPLFLGTKKFLDAEGRIAKYNKKYPVKIG
jgi:large subunit ribosomal protein L31